ncbi:Putative polyketide synthase, dehydratase domain-containing protein [Septoria linicola]|uniref:Polyketide synthase, dehydratase domain-containing protein n=1 Tax=Septoria linicola TaxID=215465 RepID=A0A9Q9B4S7_9PEZI|nr:putative polyketide synthase, dehydratase domain-containing protein [Septoria linicola]USW57357.1 Putative polyketide synthase, dehydratase domain-containing protein [Septoria linicola]
MPFPKRLSASCQQVIREALDGLPSEAKITVRSCLGDSDLQPIVMNHKCNGCILTPSSLYSDMVNTVAGYLYRKYEGNSGSPGINITDLQVHKPLLVKAASNIAQLFIEMDVSASNKAPANLHIAEVTLQCSFHSTTSEGVRLQEMGHCQATFQDCQTWINNWSHSTSTILGRMDSLHIAAVKANDDRVRLVQRDKAYKMFESFVQYGPKYQNMSEVIFDTKTLEATSTVDFPHIDHSNDPTGPYYMDAFCHLSGFVCNAVEKDKAKFAYINGGVGSIKLSHKFQRANTGSVIRNYVQMRPLPNDNTTLQGDVFVLQDDEIVGVWEQVRFKRIPRRVLDIFLPPPKK